jgi:hypothetical protein
MEIGAKCRQFVSRLAIVCPSARSADEYRLKVKDIYSATKNTRIQPLFISSNSFKTK